MAYTTMDRERGAGWGVLLSSKARGAAGGGGSGLAAYQFRLG